jgi:hypothetical protein
VSNQRIPKQNPDFVMAEYEGDLLLYNIVKEEYLTVSETAMIIWQLCDGERTQNEIVGLLVESYPDNADSIESDVQEFLDYVHENGAVIYV